MASYVIVKAKNVGAMSIAVSKDTKQRMFLSTTSVLYRRLDGNNDIVDAIEKRVVVANNQDVLKDIQRQGREMNKKLRKVCFQIFSRYGWDEEAFCVGLDWAAETSFDGLSDDTKAALIETIEIGWNTKPSSAEFYNFVRSSVEGSMIAKKQIINILLDMMEGIYTEELLSQNSTE